jgi:hypothetical protein
MCVRGGFLKVLGQVEADLRRSSLFGRIKNL